VGLSRNGSGEVERAVADGQSGSGVTDLLDVVEVTVCMAGLALGGLTEVGGDLGVALDVGDLGEVLDPFRDMGCSGVGGLRKGLSLTQGSCHLDSRGHIHESLGLSVGPANRS
jgi:hypothetical protein